MPTTVTTQAQLIAAINAANAAGGAHTITLGANITLYETTANNTHDGPNGLPEITKGDILTINGNGHTIQRSTGPFGVGDAAFRLFDVGSGATLNLNDMTLENGLVSGTTGTTFQGGAIFVDSGGTLHLNQDTLTRNAVGYTTQVSVAVSELDLQGGAVYNAGVATLTSCSITSNSATFVLNLPPNGVAAGSDVGLFDGLVGNVVVEGGGVYNVGSLTQNNGSISNNLASSTVTNGSLTFAGNFAKNLFDNGNNDGSGDGSGISSAGNSNGNGVVGNITVEGGGLYNAGGAILISASVSGNSAESTVTNGSFNGDFNGDNDAGSDDGGLNGNGVVGNITVAGGGIFNAHTLTATGTRLTGNTAASSVVNGSNNGVGNGVQTFNSDGNTNGDGVVGNILIAGGAIANFDSATLTQCTVTGNVASSTITNGSDNGVGDGDSNTGQDEGKNNGNGIAGSLEVAGAGIDNESNTSMTITSGTVSNNGASSSITNGSNNGNADGNNDGEGCGIDESITIHGGGIRNLGAVTISSVTLTGNLVQSSVFNGDGNGNSNGNNDSRSEEGRENGNGVAGGVLVAGGAIANGGTGTLTATSCSLSFNAIGSVISNGNNDGQSDGQGDSNGATDCGDFCGNGVGAGGGSLVEVDGGGLGNAGSATLNSCKVAGNDASSSVTIGVHDGIGSSDVAGNGQSDGNGIDGQLEAIGGGTANVGTLVLHSTTPTGNQVTSNVANGSGDITKDGQVVNGTVTVAGQNTFG